MVVDFVVFVDVGEFFAFNRGIVCAIVKPVAMPLYASEFSPEDVVVEMLASFEVDYENFFPVATFARNGVAQIASVVGKTDLVECNSAVVFGYIKY